MKKCIKCRFSEYATETGISEYDVCITPKKWYKNGEWETKYHNYALTTGECHKNPPDHRYGFASIDKDTIGCGEFEPKLRR